MSQGGKSGPAVFIFATFEPGTISGWNPSVNPNSSVVVVNANAWYTGLAMGVNNGANFLFGADNLNNKVDIYDGTFKLVGSFTDSKLTGLVVYGVQNINGKLYVTFRTVLSARARWTSFSTSGKLIKTPYQGCPPEGTVGRGIGAKELWSGEQRLAGGKRGRRPHQCVQCQDREVHDSVQGYEQQGHQHQWPLGAGFRTRRRNERQPQPTVLHRRPERICERSVRRDQL